KSADVIELKIGDNPWKCDVQTHKGDIIKVYYRLAMPSNTQSGVTTANVTGMISYAHIRDLSEISAYKSCFRLKEPELTWLWSYILQRWCCSQAILALLFVRYTERLRCCSW
ncbi:hypothetical protein HID58_060757, partial [Brassica napus]